MIHGTCDKQTTAEKCSAIKHNSQSDFLSFSFLFYNDFRGSTKCLSSKRVPQLTLHLEVDICWRVQSWMLWLLELFNQMFTRWMKSDFCCRPPVISSSHSWKHTTFCKLKRVSKRVKAFSVIKKCRVYKKLPNTKNEFTKWVKSQWFLRSLFFLPFRLPIIIKPTCNFQ